MEQFGFMTMRILLKPYKVGYCRSTIKIHGAIFVLTAALQKAVPMWSAINWDLLVHPHFLQLGRQGLFLYTHTHTYTINITAYRVRLSFLDQYPLAKLSLAGWEKYFQACIVEL